MRPVVLLHGFLGFDKLWDLEYFKGVPALIRRRHPRSRVLTPALNPDAPIQARAQALSCFLEKHLRPGEKAHLIAHSMGGLDARRYISSSETDGARRAATLTTLGTPHWGTPAAAWMARVFSGRKTRAYASFVKSLGSYFRGAGKTAAYLFDVLAPFDGGLSQMTPEAMRVFNRRHPNRPSVAYFSYAGVVRKREDLSPLLGPFHERITACSDPVVGGPNDGLVSEGSARGDSLGENGFRFVGTLKADHFNLIGHDWAPAARFTRWLSGKRPRRFLSVYEEILTRIEDL